MAMPNHIPVITKVVTRTVIITQTRSEQQQTFFEQGPPALKFEPSAAESGSTADFAI